MRPNEPCNPGFSVPDSEQTLEKKRSFYRGKRTKKQKKQKKREQMKDAIVQIVMRMERENVSWDLTTQRKARIAFLSDEDTEYVFGVNVDISWDDWTPKMLIRYKKWLRTVGTKKRGVFLSNDLGIDVDL